MIPDLITVGNESWCCEDRQNKDKKHRFFTQIHSFLKITQSLIFFPRILTFCLSFFVTSFQKSGSSTI